jgi:hypothetical protein
LASSHSLEMMWDCPTLKELAVGWLLKPLEPKCIFLPCSPSLPTSSLFILLFFEPEPRYADYVGNISKKSYVIGAHWYEWEDEVNIVALPHPPPYHFFISSSPLLSVLLVRYLLIIFSLLEAVAATVKMATMVW